MAGHRKVADAGICAGVANIVSNPAIKHPLAERVLKRERRLVHSPPPRPFSVNSLHVLAPLANLGQDGNIAVKQTASQAQQLIQPPVALDRPTRGSCSPSDRHPTLRTAHPDGVTRHIAQNTTTHAAHIRHRRLPLPSTPRPASSRPDRSSSPRAGGQAHSIRRPSEVSTTDKAWWDPAFIQRLAEHRRLILFDNRGTGNSTGSSRGLTIRRMADDAVGLIHGLKLRRTDVLGWSMGGFIAQQLALDSPRLSRRA